MSDDEEDYVCPICMDELDIADRGFTPCDCGYQVSGEGGMTDLNVWNCVRFLRLCAQVCVWCFHHMKENLSDRCPACRNTYKDFDAIVKQSVPSM